jgi:transcriptional regulator with XRE-family HTH domain
MEASGAPATLPAGRGLSGRDAGAIVRAARQSAGLTLAELGERCGYSPSQISRYERGIQPLTDVRLLRQFAAALSIPPQHLGLLPHLGATRHASAEHSHPGSGRPRVGTDTQPDEGEEPVRRRELLSQAAGLAGAAALGMSAARPDQSPSLERLLYDSPSTEPASLSALRTAAAEARDSFQNARYERLAASLPGLVGTAAATRDGSAEGQRAAASSLLAEAYIVASGLLVKLHDDAFAWTLADRALQAAQAGDDPLTFAESRRSIAMALRRVGRPAQARGLLDRAIRDMEPGPHATPAHLSVYGTLLETAAYTAAVDGSRRDAGELIGEARDAAARLGSDANYRHTAFGPSNVRLYQVSIAQVLGDNGTAIEHARAVRPAAIPTAERRGRYWIDVARAWHQWGKPENCYRALLSAERAAPAEVRYRPPVHRITEDLLRADHWNALPGLRSFAQRVGVPGSGLA